MRGVFVFYVLFAESTNLVFWVAQPTCRSGVCRKAIILHLLYACLPAWPHFLEEREAFLFGDDVTQVLVIDQVVERFRFHLADLYKLGVFKKEEEEKSKGKKKDGKKGELLVMLRSSSSFASRDCVRQILISFSIHSSYSTSTYKFPEWLAFFPGPHVPDTFDAKNEDVHVSMHWKVDIARDDRGSIELVAAVGVGVLV